MYDSDAETRAMEHPVLKVQGWTYRGRLLSERQMAPFRPLLDPEMDQDERLVMEMRLFRVVFRRRWWQFWKPDPVLLIGNMEWDVYLKFKADFFGCLARRNAKLIADLQTIGIALPN